MMKRILSLIAALLLVMMMPLTVLAASIGDQGTLDGEPERPYEKLIFDSGKFTTQRDLDRMYLTYAGSYDMDDDLDYTDMDMTLGDEFHTKLKIRSDIYLREVQMVYTFPMSEGELPEVYCTLEDEVGNQIGPYLMVPHEGVAYDLENDTALELSYSLESEQDILLKSGDYKLTTTHTDQLVRNKQTGIYGAVALKAVDQEAWDKYEEKWLEWAFELQGVEKDKAEMMINAGSDALYDYLYNDEEYRLELNTISQMPTMPVIELTEDAILHELVFNTFNGGEGALPGDITILDEDSEVLAIYQAAGDTLSDVPNGMWVIRPDLPMKAGSYTIIPSDPSVLVVQEDGYPEYFASFGPPLEPSFNFSGHYKLDMTIIKTSNVMGPVSTKVPSLELKRHDFDLVDHGDSIEIISEYEDIMFAQVCEVISREENDGVAVLDFDLDLTRTPVGANVGADVSITMVHNDTMAPKVTIEGEGFYFRASKDELDDNGYAIEGVAYQSSKYFSNLVTKALAAAGISGLDNIPGPDFPIHVMAGVALPSLVGVLGQMMSSILDRRKKEAALEALRAQEVGGGLSVGEEAMKRSNESFGDGLVSEEDKEGFAILADAMANTDEPDDDPFSIGDNESTSSNEPTSNEGDYEDEYEGDYPEESPWADGSNPEDVEKQMDDWMEYPYGGYSEESLEEIREANGGILPEREPVLPWEDDYEEIPEADWDKRTIIDNSTGQDMEIVKDPYTGEWINPESGNPINLETYEKDVLPNLERDAATIAKHRVDNLKRDPDLVKAFDKIRKDAHTQEQLIKLQRKYGYNLTEKEIIAKIGRNELRDTIISQTQRERGDMFDKMLLGAEIIQIGADMGIDILADATGPMGKAIKYTYVGVKGYAGATTNDYINSAGSKKSFWKSSITGIGKGGGDLLKAGASGMLDKSGGFVKYLGQGVANVGGNVITAIGNKVANGSKNFGGDIYNAVKQGAAETGIGAGFDYIGSSFGKLGGMIPKSGKDAILGQIKGFTTNHVNSTIEGKKGSTGSELIDMMMLKKNV